MARRRLTKNEIQRLDTENPLKCPLCLDTFETPRALACLHTFCERCLVFYINDCKASVRDGRLEKIDCPICHYPTVPPDVLKHPHALVKDLPLNHFILPHLEIVERRSITENSSRMSYSSRLDQSSVSEKRKSVQFTQTCGSCTERGMAVEAAAYCHDCDDYQCKECVEGHTRIKMLTMHRIVSIDRMTSGSQVSNAFNKHNICLIHQTEELKIYCPNHDTMLCSCCAIAKHKACDMVNEFEELGANLKHGDDIKHLKDNMKGLQKALKDMAEVMRANNYGLELEAEEIPKRIQSMKAKMLRLFNYLEEKAHQKIQQFQAEHGKKNSDKAYRYKQLLAAIEGSCIAVDTVLDHGSNQHAFVTFQRLKNQLQEYDELVKQEKESLTCTSIQLKIEDALNTIVNETEELGDLFVESSKPDLAELPPLLFVKREDTVVDKKPIFVKTGKLKTADVNIHRKCITATIMDKKLVLVYEVRNRTWYSYSYALIDTEALAEVFSADLKRDPRNIITIDDNNFAVTYPSGGFIEFYMYTPKRRKKPLTINMNHTLKCDIQEAVISKYSKQDFAVSTGNYFAIMSHEGIIKRLFYYSVSLRPLENDFWNTQLTVEHVVVNFKKKRIYILTSKPFRIYSFNPKGEVQFSYSFEKPVTSLDLDKDGNLCACSGDGTAAKLLEISPNTGKLLQAIALETKCPYIVSFNRKGGHFYIVENHTKFIQLDKYRLHVENEQFLFNDD